MKVLKICSENYRNLNTGCVDFCDGFNFIYGDNAQGKTNLLESVWMLTGARSFRGTKDENLINFEKDFAKIDARVFMNERNQEIKLVFDGEKRKAFLNDVPQRYATQLIGSFKAVLFSPTHVSLVCGGPEKRRKFLDAAICQRKPTYTSILVRYNQLIRQRNTLLKNKYNTQDFEGVLNVLDVSLSHIGAQILKYRLDYMKKLVSACSNIYSEISSGKEKIQISYISRIIKNENLDVDLNEIEELMFQKLKSSLEFDLKTGFTNNGPHKDDLSILVNEKSVKNFGSQGQQRSAALALKLAEADILEENFNDPPVILLDDVMSELDDARKSYMLKKAKNRQVLITACDRSALEMVSGGFVFKVKDGKITKI